MTVQVGAHLEPILTGRAFRGTKLEYVWVVVSAYKDNFIAVPVHVGRNTVGVRISFLYGDIPDFFTAIATTRFVTEHPEAWKKFRELHPDVASDMLRWAGIAVQEES